MVFTRSQTGSSPRSTRTSTSHPSFLDKITGRNAAANPTATTTSSRTGRKKMTSSTFGTNRRGVSPTHGSSGIFSGKGRHRTVGTGPLPMSHHQNATATMGDRVHGAARKAAGAISGDVAKEQSGDAMMHGGANPNTGIKGGFFSSKHASSKDRTGIKQSRTAGLFGKKSGHSSMTGRRAPIV